MEQLSRAFFRLYIIVLSCIVANDLVCSPLGLSVALGAESELTKEKNPSNKRVPENWYLYFGGGLATVDYDLKTKKDIDALRKEANEGTDTRMTLHLDYLGFYWPVTDRLLLGLTGTATADFWMGKGEDESSVQVQQTFFNASGIYFFSDSDHRPFLRTEFGLGALTMNSRKGPNGEGRNNVSNGFGIAAGGGYAWAVSRGANLMTNLLASYRTAGGRRISSVALVFGVLL